MLLFLDDDSDADLVTDYLSGSIDLNNKVINLNNTPKMTTASVVTPVHHSTPQNNNNMVPIISVTPHSPGTKYNCILGKFCFLFYFYFFWFNSIFFLNLYFGRGHIKSFTMYSRKCGTNEKYRHKC